MVNVDDPDDVPGAAAPGKHLVSVYRYPTFLFLLDCLICLHRSCTCIGLS